MVEKEKEKRGIAFGFDVLYAILRMLCHVFFFSFNHTRLEVTLGVSVHLLTDYPEQAIPVRLHIDNVEPL